jgi:hypothetical protein
VLYAIRFFAGEKTYVLRAWWQNREAILRCRCAAQGIVAESPQDLHWQIRGLEAESPVFGPP